MVLIFGVELFDDKCSNFYYKDGMLVSEKFGVTGMTGFNENWVESGVVLVLKFFTRSVLIFIIRVDSVLKKIVENWCHWNDMFLTKKGVKMRCCFLVLNFLMRSVLIYMIRVGCWC